VWERARAIITNPETVARELERVRESDPTAEDARAVVRFLTGIERQRGNLSRAIATLDDLDAAAPLVLQLRELAERDRALRAEQATLEERRAAWQSTQADLDSLTRWCSTVAGRVDSLSWEQRRSALTALNFGATVYPRDHEPRFVVTADVGAPTVSNTT
jgi:hypothetical protein